MCSFQRPCVCVCVRVRVRVRVRVFVAKSLWCSFVIVVVAGVNPISKNSMVLFRACFVVIGEERERSRFVTFVFSLAACAHIH